MFLHERVVRDLAHERQERARAEALARRRSGHSSHVSIRRRVGESLVRLGHRLAADADVEKGYTHEPLGP
jgi:hypothetical protein